MKAILSLSSAFCFMMSIAWADGTAPMVTSAPDGWIAQADGGYAHPQSGVVCAKAIGTYKFVRLDGPSDPGILGVCVYSGGDVRVGEIRVRKFIDGVGDTPLAVQNDRVLMGLVPMAGAPPGANIVAAHREGPGPMIDGNATSQSVVTNLRNGLLVDCISQTKRDSTAALSAFNDFEKACAFSGQ
jgi:hypothetical protein